MKEHINYNTGRHCEFRHGKLRGGIVLEEQGDKYLIGTYAPNYCEFIISKTKVKLYNQKFGYDYNNN